jgi:hypothetical protein
MGAGKSVYYTTTVYIKFHLLHTYTYSCIT